MKLTCLHSSEVSMDKKRQAGDPRWAQLQRPRSLFYLFPPTEQQFSASSYAWVETDLIDSWICLSEKSGLRDARTALSQTT